VTALCSQCRLPLPLRPYRDESADLTFCCAGCLLVFRIVGATGDEGSANWFLAKLGLAAILSGNIMMFQSLLYFGSLQALGSDVIRTASWIMLALSLGVFLILGVPMLRLTLQAARQGRLVLETLIALGAFASIAVSAWETFHGGIRTYYDSGTMVLVFVVLGQYLDARARQRATESLARPLKGTRRLARLVRGTGETEVDPGTVAQGERIFVHPGEEIPVDGTIKEGRSDISEPALTGESVPWTAGVGDRVRAGSVAIDGSLVVEASGESETLAEKIAGWAARARAERGPLELAADRFVARFIPLVALVALMSLLYFGFLGRWGEGGLAALSVLVIACPCALGIATPMATTLALSRAASRGVLIRSGAVLESLASVNAVAFDKTGTLTRGRPRVRAVRIGASSPVAEGEAWSLVAAVEALVPHPFAAALVEEAAERGAPKESAEGVRAIPGGGAEGRVGGHVVVVGSAELLAERRGDSYADEIPQDGLSHVGVAIDGRLALQVDLEDPPRPEAAEALRDLRAAGIGVSLLSGDREGAVNRMADLGFDTLLSALAPQQKPEAVRSLRDGGRKVAMVGDGLNDAPALAAADVGVAFGRAADLARQTADVVILREDLRLVPGVLALARKTRRIVAQNLLWAFGYNAIGILMAASGVLRPVIAAAAMVLSSLFVVGNSLRLRPREGSAGAPGI
jgi:Cu2+-exporting ATPase